METYTTPKYPRVIVSVERHKKLAAEAAKKKISISELVEAKLKTVK